MESLFISHFGPIEEINLTSLPKYTVFIGESGSGKSSVMKVLAMMRWLYKMNCVRTYLKISGMPVPFRLRLDTIMGYNGLKPYLKGNTEIEYRNGSFVIQIHNGKLVKSEGLVPLDELTLQKVAYISDKRVMIPDLAVGNISLRHNMFYLDETFLNFQKAVDSISVSEMNYLGVRLAVKKSSTGKKITVSALDKKAPFEDLPLTSASSGMQSSVALHFIINYFSKRFDIVEAMNSTILKYLAVSDNLSKFSATLDVGKFPRKCISLHIEEPELSLFPLNQWGLMKYLVQECASAANAKLGMTLATHSPYILTALNIMMLAKEASGKDAAEYDKLGLDIPFISKDEVGAWLIEAGRCYSLYNEELGMIDGTSLDRVSDDFENLILRLNDIIYG
ncbi:MAG: hypothetical protein K2K64_03250 [Muribaculaceae bacterium]|nr:hypothetical protein [Muribaculaceae bacterium]MDE7109127.1 hypothetical protein [Muribaculaceae bacterium]